MAESDVPNIGHHSIGRGMKDEHRSAANLGGDTKTAAKKKNCWQTCTYPSHCRWGKAVGIHTPSPSTATFSFDRFPSASDTHMADLPSLDACCDHSSPANGSNHSSDAEMLIDPSILSQSSSFISLPSPLAQGPQASADEGEEGDVMQEVVSEPGEMALEYPLGEDALMGARGSSVMSIVEMDGVRGRTDGKDRKREKKARSLRRCVAVTGLRVRTALF
ncbi:hypothetical protein E8E13_003340 [Curvularia kusanoi]|uniref:Uncharacterized protein n=1 Tax=Curvularia kusanoi TaxID=90978 RepID=A0A9P4T5B8_CURKU|nr:hypothetical protein E8E13_003340 [Curvularia kusanoi]